MFDPQQPSSFSILSKGTIESLSSLVLQTVGEGAC